MWLEALKEVSGEQDEKRPRILCATLNLLARYGFHGFSMKQVAKDAGVAAGTIYCHFKDREDLIKQLQMEIVQDVSREAFRHWDEQAPAFESYRGMCLRLWSYFQAHPEVLLCKSQFEQLPKDVLISQQQMIVEDFFRPIYRLFDEGRRSGKLANLSDVALFSMSLGSVFDLARNQILGLITVDQAQLEQLIESTWRGISSPQ